MNRLSLPTVVIASLLACSSAQAQYGDISALKLHSPMDAVDVKQTPPPPSAIVLFDGKSLKNWVKARRKDKGKPAAWKLQKKTGVMQVNGTGDIMSRFRFGGSFKLHVEFRVPYMPKKAGQGRGNSGVYVQGRYEIQVLDSYGLKSKTNDCGAVYEVAAPKVNACKAPTIWQSYDILFSAPVFKKDRDTKKLVKVRPTLMTVWHNGVKIHDSVKIMTENTRAGLGGDIKTPGPIMLQDHGNPVQFRNIWVLLGPSGTVSGDTKKSGKKSSE